MYPEGYPDTRILMYLDLTCTSPKNTCKILIFCMYFTRIPKESKIHLGYTSDTSRYMYLLRFLGVTLDIYQDTSKYVYHSSSRYMQDPCEIHAGYMICSGLRDTYGIHEGYTKDTYPIGNVPQNDTRKRTVTPLVSEVGLSQRTG